MRIFLAMVIFLLLVMKGSAQQVFPVYYVYDRPVEIPQGKIDSVNHLLVTVKTDLEAFRIIRNKLRLFPNTLIPIRKALSATKTEHCQYSIGDARKTSVSMADKTVWRGDDVIHYSYQFREILRDTLRIIDTLIIQVALTDVNQPLNGYYLKITGSDSSSIKIAVQHLGKGYLKISKPDYMADIFNKAQYCELYNTQSSKNLATFFISFLNDDEVIELSEQVETLKKLNGGVSLPDKTLADYLYGFANDRFGIILKGNIESWLKSTR